MVIISYNWQSPSARSRLGSTISYIRVWRGFLLQIKWPIVTDACFGRAISHGQITGFIDFSISNTSRLMPLFSKPLIWLCREQCRSQILLTHECIYGSDFIWVLKSAIKVKKIHFYSTKATQTGSLSSNKQMWRLIKVNTKHLHKLLVLNYEYFINLHCSSFYFMEAGKGAGITLRILDHFLSSNGINNNNNNNNNNNSNNNNKKNIACRTIWL